MALSQIANSYNTIFEGRMEDGLKCQISSLVEYRGNNFF